MNLWVGLVQLYLTRSPRARKAEPDKGRSSSVLQLPLFLLKIRSLCDLILLIRAENTPMF